MTRSAPRPSAEGLAGDLVALLEQLGGVTPEAGSATEWLPAATPPAHPTLETSLAWYREHLLAPVELPAIWRAWKHAHNGGAQELLRLDRELSATLRSQPFASASRHAGRNQLHRLRPLRDVKLVQRYLQAIEAGEVAGWHTLVYGLTLAVYSLPPREGMLAYARQTLGILARRSARGASVSEADVIAATEQECSRVTAVINQLIGETVLRPALPLPGREARH